MELILNCFRNFPHNERYLNVLVKFLKVIFARAEFYANIDVDNLINFIVEYLLIYKAENTFYNKSKLLVLLQFLL